MAVDLSELVETLKDEVNPPGENIFPNATDDEWARRLAGAFWNARMEGFLVGYVEADGQVMPVSGTTDLPRDLQQLIVFMAAFTAVMNKLRELRTRLRTKSGPVEFETESSANVLREHGAYLRERYALLLRRLSDGGEVPDYVIDAVAERLSSGTWLR